MKPEDKARQHIDHQLEQAAWVIQDMKQLNLAAGVGVAVREFITDSGQADYLLFVNRHAVDVIEAKRDTAGENLTTVDALTERYNVQRLASPSIDPHSQVCISSIQRMYAILSGEPTDKSAEGVAA